MLSVMGVAPCPAQCPSKNQALAAVSEQKLDRLKVEMRESPQLRGRFVTDRRYYSSKLAAEIRQAFPEGMPAYFQDLTDSKM